MSCSVLALFFVCLKVVHFSINIYFQFSIRQPSPMVQLRRGFSRSKEEVLLCTIIDTSFHYTILCRAQTLHSIRRVSLSWFPLYYTLSPHYPDTLHQLLCCNDQIVRQAIENSPVRILAIAIHEDSTPGQGVNITLCLSLGLGV